MDTAVAYGLTGCNDLAHRSAPRVSSCFGTNVRSSLSGRSTYQTSVLMDRISSALSPQMPKTQGLPRHTGRVSEPGHSVWRP